MFDETVMKQNEDESHLHLDRPLQMDGFAIMQRSSAKEIVYKSSLLIPSFPDSGSDSRFYFMDLLIASNYLLFCSNRLYVYAHSMGATGVENL